MTGGAPHERQLAALLAALAPRRHEGTFVFACVPHAADLRGLAPVATVLEDEGRTLVLREDEAAARGVPYRFRAAWITLTVASDLHAVGLTAAVAAALAREGIACNVIAGAVHDHLFVPVERADDAMRVLAELAAPS